MQWFQTGMKDAGYVYINLDDCWHGQRDSQGFIHADAVNVSFRNESLG